MTTRYYDSEPLSKPFVRFCNDRDYTSADVESDPDLRKRLEAEFAEHLRAKAGS